MVSSAVMGCGWCITRSLDRTGADRVSIDPHEHSKMSVSHRHLTFFLGDDGLMGLLSFFHERGFANEEEVLEMINRLHIPGYEHACHYFDAAIRKGVFKPNSPTRYPSQYHINAILEWLRLKT